MSVTIFAKSRLELSVIFSILMENIVHIDFAKMAFFQNQKTMHKIKFDHIIKENIFGICMRSHLFVRFVLDISIPIGFFRRLPPYMQK